MIKKDERDGKGVLYWKNGDKYEGVFKKGDRSGKGIKYVANGNYMKVIIKIITLKEKE